jgi:hypothetical protein
MDGITDRFVSVSFEPPYDVTECGKCARPGEEVPLSWSINTKDRERLLSGMNRGRNLEERARLRAWWKPALAQAR